MGEPPHNNCSDCLAFAPDGNGARSGRCRRFAPVPAPGGDAQAIWPRVNAGDWCLEHRQNVEPYGLTFVPEAPPR